MSRLSRWTAALLAVCILINLIPVPSFAQTEKTVPTEAVPSTSDETTAYPEETVVAILETDSTEEVTQPTEEITLPTEEVTQPTEEITVPTEEVTQPTEEVTVPTEDETVPTEEETLPLEPVMPLSTLEVDESPATYSDFSAKYFAQILRDNDYSEAEIKTIIPKSGDKVTLKIGMNQGGVLELLSKTFQGNQTLEGETDVFDYSGWIIDFSGITGVLGLPDGFSGLGDEGYPFAGTLSGPSISVSTSNTLFKALDAGADLGSKSIVWTGTADKAILATTLYVDGDAHSVDMPLTSATAFSPYIGRLVPKEGVPKPGEITLPALNYNPGTSSGASEGASEKEYTGDAGLLCGSMAANTKLTAGTLTLPGIPVSITSSSGNAGTLVGSMGSGAKLTISQDNLSLSSTLTADNGSAGGLVGSMAENAVLHISGALTLTTTVTNSENAGGLVGTMENGSNILLGTNLVTEEGSSIPVNANITVSNTLNASESAGGIAGKVTTSTGPITFENNAASKITLGDASTVTGGTNAGGLYGSCTASGDLTPLNGVSITQVKLNSNAKDQRANLGGLFGTLTLSGDGNQCTCSFNNSPLSVTLLSVTGDTYLGGIVGTLNGSTPSNRKNALIVNKPNIQISNSGLTPQYLGGIVAWQNATVDVTGEASKNTVSFDYPHTAGSKKKHSMGGLSAYICDGMLLVADTVKISNTNSNYPATDQNGGIAGSANKGSIVYLLNSTDLSGCPMTSTSTSGMLVASQDCSLVYSPGATITRYNKAGMELDDIGNYGELYRLPDFVTLDRTAYSTVLPKLIPSGDTYVFDDATDYACFALAWQSRGNFPTVSDITASNWTGLKTATIRLDADIDLSNGGNGYGIGGLSRDVYSADDTFSGKLYGEGSDGVIHTITLGIGNRYCASTNIASITSDGRIYFHNSPGLFAGLSSTATVEDLTLAGSIRLSNNRLPVNDTDQSANMKTGALAGLLLCEGDGSNITKVSTTVNITANSNTVTPNAPFYIGGLFGLAYGNDATTLTLDGNLGASISHAITESDAVPIIGQCFHTGGAIGAVDADCTQLKIECNGAVISGKIERTNHAADNFYAGGLIGTIFPNGSSSRTIELKKLTLNGFTLSGSADKRMGGVLGGIWADTDVTVSGLVVENATLTASGTAKLGGLVYRASGKWEVSSADLSGLTITASSAEGLGLMVCQGGTYREPLRYNKDNASSSEAYIEIDGLYLVMTENWGWKDNKGYNVPTSIAFGGVVFDEFVAYTAYADYTYDDRDAPRYSITSNGSGIISLKTANDTVNMTGDVSDRNTYENRTDVAKKTNLYSRYYYNLPKVKAESDMKDSTCIDTPEELLIWSVNRYAATNLKDYFPVSGNTIGGSSSASRAGFNMSGLSYYPIRITDSDITVQYADVMFHNKQIEDQVSAEKSTRGSDGEHTQHYTMHCGLFLDFAAEALEYPVAQNYTMTVNGVSFAGTIGKVDGQSGALLCGTVRGKSSGKIATCTVKLADGGDSTEAVTLNGITVDSKEGYKPVLIGQIWEYATLQANYVTVSSEQKTVAGSSLVGDVGHSAATGLAITFAGTIKLPSENNSVFTSATLLNSLRYQGSTPATYQFVKEKDWKDGKHDQNVTYGFEISESKEFVDEQLWYFDEGYVSSTTPEADGPGDFSKYLPYVAHSPAKPDPNNTYTVENGYHELEVNVKPANLLTGCGTYGDPYVLDSEKLLKSVAKYLEHPEKTIDGWKILYPASGYHSDSSNDTTLTFDSESKSWSGNYSIDDIRKHLASAYYVIDKDNMNLVSFSGLGTEDYPFSGVIQGKNNQPKKIEMSGTSQALIQYSNGSVVRNLKITLAQSAPLRSSAPEMASGQRTANRAPKYFFGGVIGCVLGGDNIIENVEVSTGDTPYNFPEGYKSFEHLVPIGGYVGVIAGGGVIFRGTCSGGISNADTNKDSKFLYRNPIVGRVLGGYAFYDGTGTAPDNTNKNYKINAIKPGTHLSLSGDTLTIKDAEGLLLLSAIVSSGAGSYGNSLAYKTGYGVARVAKFDQIGKDENIASSDYALAEQQTTPYLLHRENITTKFCPEDPQNLGQTGITLKLDANLDMSSYGSGYRGLSARYVSNAGFTNTSTLSPYTVVMRLKSFDGNGKTVSGIRMDVREYDDDDFHAASIGGIFNIVWTNRDTGGGSSNANNTASQYDSVLAKNLTLSNCMVKLQYVDKNGTEVRQAMPEYFTLNDGLSAVAVGGFIGTVNNISPSATGMDSKNSNYLFTYIRVAADEGKRSTIYGPNGAGTIIGATGMKSTGYPGKLLTNGATVRFGPSFLNCSYSNTDATGYLAAGGMVGCAAVDSLDFYSFGSEQKGTDGGCYATCTITDENLAFASNSTVTTKAAGGICGGVFGGIGMRGLINDQTTVNTQTGLTIIGNNASVKTLKFDDVDILADVAFSDYIYTDTGGTKNGLERGGVIAGAGCIARISNPNDVRIYQVKMGSNADGSKRCTITAKRTDTTGAQYAGGLVAYGYTTKDMTISDCKVYSTDISGPTAGGLIAVSGFKNLKISNCAIEDSKINASTRAGGLAGYLNYANCTANLFNILIKDTSVTRNNAADDDATGRLFGQIHKDYQLTPYAAGISVFAKHSTIQLPDKDSASSYATGYIAYANYLAEQKNYPSGSKAPYVTVNPSYSLRLNGGTEDLYGDAVKDSDSYGSVAGQIWTENRDNAVSSKGNYASYPEAKDLAMPSISTFNKELGEGPEDLPVLVVKGGDSSAITNYLDIITNGGYTAASTAGKVTFTAPVYYWDDANKLFDTKTTDPTHDGPPAVTIVNNTPVVSGTSYDNSRHRFTLVKTTFETSLGNYTVSIPVVVLRKLEYVYMTTFSYGTEFHKETYQDIQTHLLESTDVPFSVYLTFLYNQAYNASATTPSKLEYAEYDWKSYIEGGGNLIGMDKTLKFSVTLPKDTQLTLVDCQHGNQAYYYTVKEGGEQNIDLSSFLKDPAAENPAAFPFSMADVLGVKRSERSEKTGAFTKLPSREGATLLVNGEYFRPAKDGDAADSRFNLIFPENPSSAVPEENYYLVITVPTQYNSENQVNTAFYRNGHLEVDIEGYLMQTNGTQVHRYGNNSVANNHESDETTYQISSGYQQLLEASNTHTAPVDLNDVKNAMQMELKDTITFSNGQAYSDTDLLFLKFTASLKQKGADEAGTPTEADSGFPAGTRGTAIFYIQDSGGNYYVPNGNGWKQKTNEPDLSYDWVSDGGNLSLPLSADGNTPIDLSGVRTLIKGTQSAGTSEIIVTAKMENVVVPPGGDDDPIPSSEDGTDTWAQIHYLAQLSTQARSLNYSTVRAVADDTAHYYRKAVNKVILSMDAAKIRQLGVNPLAPVNDDLVDGRSRIDLNAALDMTGLKDREALLQKTDRIVFTLSLERRNDGAAGIIPTYEPVTNGADYISFLWPYDTKGWSFTVSKEDGQFEQGFNEDLYLFPLTAYVAMDQTQYANYQIKMDVTFVGDYVLPNGSIDTSDAYVVYTYACINPTFYDNFGQNP